MTKYVEKFKLGTDDIVIRDPEINVLVNELATTSSFYDEITYTKGRTNGSDYYVIEVPKTDTDGNVIELVPAATNGLKPSEHAWEELTTVTMNGSYGISPYGDPINIGNGVILNNNPISDVADYYGYLAMDAERNVFDLQMNTTLNADTLVSQGMINVFPYFYKIVEGGSIHSDPQRVADEVGLTREPRMAVGLRSDGTIIIFSCDGRNLYSSGMTADETAQCLLDLGCSKGWMLDAGGSSAAILKGSRLNGLYDSHGTVERSRNFVVDIKKTTVVRPIAEAMVQAGRTKLNLEQLLMPLINTKAASYCTVNDPTLNTLAANNTYQSILMPTVTSIRSNLAITGDVDSKNGNNFTRFKVDNFKNETLWFRISATIQLTAAAAGNKNLAYRRYNVSGTSSIRNFMSQTAQAAGDRVILTIDLWDTLVPGMCIAFDVSGATGDTIDRAILKVEYFS